MVALGRELTTLALVVFLGAGTALAGEAKGEKPTETARNANLPAKSLPLAPATDDYRLGVNDIVDVYIWKEPELSRVVPVRPDGKISLPLVGEVEVEGRTPIEVREVVLARLKAYVAEPEVTVIVQQINSQRYFVIGEVQSPGAYPLTVPTTALQALSMAGGFREFADTDEITILRQQGSDGTIRIKFSYNDWVKDKKKVEHFLLKNGDVIVVP